MRVIEIIVSPQGEANVETKGFLGNDCQKASHFLVGVLGTKARERLKPEFHIQADQSEKIEHGS